MYKKTDEIFVRINKGGFIPYIGICGPIPNPIKVKTEICLKLVNAGIDVHQFDPVTKKTIKLTRENVFDDNKFGKKKEEVKQPANDQKQVENHVQPMEFKGVQKPVEPVDVETPSAVEPVVEEKVIGTPNPTAEKKESVENIVNQVNNNNSKKNNKK